MNRVNPVRRERAEVKKFNWIVSEPDLPFPSCSGTVGNCVLLDELDDLAGNIFPGRRFDSLEAG